MFEYLSQLVKRSGGVPSTAAAATPRVTSEEHQLHVRALQAAHTMRVGPLHRVLQLLRCFQRAISFQCRVLSTAGDSKISHSFGIVQIFLQHHPPFQRCQLRTFHVPTPAVLPSGARSCSLWWDTYICSNILPAGRARLVLGTWQGHTARACSHGARRDGLSYHKPDLATTMLSL